MKGLISISLYGQGAKYSFGAVENAKLAKTIYPEWDIRFYVEENHYAIPALKCQGAQVVEMPFAEGSRGMFWRFLAADDSNYSHVIVRDADSRLNVRGKACVDGWVSSGKTLHVIRDHPAHENVDILGGAWGIKTGVYEFKDAIALWDHSNSYGDDEAFLGQNVWGGFRDDVVRHTFNPKCEQDTAIPPHAPYNGFVCEQVEPSMPDSYRSVVLSPAKYANRLQRFHESLHKSGCFLTCTQHYLGDSLGDRVIPTHFDHNEEFPHYYLATRSHIEIIEKAILDDVAYLFVFEDDAKFTPDFHEYLFRMMAALPEDWLGAMLGGQNDWAREHVSEGSHEALARVTGCLGMHGVLWNRKGLKRAFDHFTYWNRNTIDQAFVGLQKETSAFYAPAKWIVDIDPLAEQYGLDS